MRKRTEALDNLIFLILKFQLRKRKPVKRIVLPEQLYRRLLFELYSEDMDTIYGAELKHTILTDKIVLS